MARAEYSYMSNILFGYKLELEIASSWSNERLSPPTLLSLLTSKIIYMSSGARGCTSYAPSRAAPHSQPVNIKNNVYEQWCSMSTARDCTSCAQDRAAPQPVNIKR